MVISKLNELGKEIIDIHKTIKSLENAVVKVECLLLVYVGVVLLSVTIFIGGLIHISVFVPLGNTGK